MKGIGEIYRDLKDNSDDEHPAKEVHKSWSAVERHIKDVMAVVIDIEKKSQELTDAYKKLMPMLPKLFLLIPKTDDLYQSCPFRPSAVKLSLKIHLRKIGFDVFPFSVNATMADVELKKFSEQMKELLKYALKHKPQE